MSPISIDNFTVCRTCAGLAGYPPVRKQYPQLCRCHREGQVRWPDHDFNEYVDLCWCCLLERIPSGSRWSPFYCPECLERAHGYNESMGGVLLYVGRHSLMNGVWVREGRLARPQAPAALCRAVGEFALGICGFFEAMDRWRPTRLQAVLRAVGREVPGQGESEEIGLVEYLRAAGRLADDRELAKRASFDAVCRFLGYPPAGEVIEWLRPRVANPGHYRPTVEA